MTEISYGDLDEGEIGLLYQRAFDETESLAPLDKNLREHLETSSIDGRSVADLSHAQDPDPSELPRP